MVFPPDEGSEAPTSEVQPARPQLIGSRAVKHMPSNPSLLDIYNFHHTGSPAHSSFGTSPFSQHAGSTSLPPSSLNMSTLPPGSPMQGMSTGPHPSFAQPSSPRFLYRMPSFNNFDGPEAVHPGGGLVGGAENGMKVESDVGDGYGHNYSCCGTLFGTYSDYVRHWRESHGAQGVPLTEPHFGEIATDVLGFAGSDPSFASDRLHPEGVWSGQPPGSQFSTAFGATPAAPVTSMTTALNDHITNTQPGLFATATSHVVDPALANIFDDQPTENLDAATKRRLSAAAFSLGSSYNKGELKRFREDFGARGVNFADVMTGHEHTGTEEEMDAELDVPHGGFPTIQAETALAHAVPSPEAMGHPRTPPMAIPTPMQIPSRMPRPDLFPELASFHQQRLEQQIRDQQQQLYRLQQLQQIQLEQQRQLQLLTQQTQIAQQQLHHATLQQRYNPPFQHGVVGATHLNSLTNGLTNGLPHMVNMEDQLDYVIKNFQLSKIATPPIPPVPHLPSPGGLLFGKTEQADGMEDAVGEADEKSTVVKPYKCHHPGCTKAYKNSSGLKYHLQHGHAVAKREVLFGGEGGLGSDMESPTVFKPYRCQVDSTCTKRYKNLNGLKYHLVHAHPEVDVKQLLSEAKIDGGMQVAALTGGSGSGELYLDGAEALELLDELMAAEG
ncbi:Transcriptional regulator of ribosomal biogenesis proteins [Rhizophlyctis rosea]|nr:Transcriptional regulator of ribosomal biogenesis proteins [Rhizophlyctis rosea]